MHPDPSLPLATVARVILAALLILCAAVLLGDFRVRGLAYREPWSGWLGRGARASSLRWSLVLALVGFAIWGWALAWPWPVPIALVALALIGLGADVYLRRASG